MIFKEIPPSFRFDFSITGKDRNRKKKLAETNGL